MGLRQQKAYAPFKMCANLSITGLFVYIMRLQERFCFSKLLLFYIFVCFMFIFHRLRDTKDLYILSEIAIFYPFKEITNITFLQNYWIIG